MVKMANRGGTSTALALAAAMALGAGSVAVVAPPEQAAAVTEYEYQQKVSNHNSLKKQLTGVDSKLADLIISLNDLTENQISRRAEGRTGGPAEGRTGEEPRRGDYGAA